jgi:hypothetical protein
VEVLERRKDDGKGSWRRKFVSISGRELLSCGETIVLRSPGDIARHIPFKKGEEWTVRDLRLKEKIHPTVARKAVWTLKTLGLIRQTGMRGNAYVYTRV